MLKFFHELSQKLYPLYKGTLVTTITANDLDGGHFGSDSIIYRLEGLGSEKFSINNRTGTVTVAECVSPGSGICLDFETKSEYIFQFIVSRII